ncbi:hypothetical protein QM012_003787 [Aureobasidium pullulans]|uniref:Uncharacterized protein n=1 Tax=Aureobasidium pullulans TaxID=5580 RepID=A0ABR0T7X4_AURPU
MLMRTILIYHFLTLCAVALAFNVPQTWIIGLRDNRTLDQHLALINTTISVEQIIPEINGYAMPVSEDDDEHIISAIRQDHLVGFVVQEPRGFFSETGHLGLEGEDLMEYEDERMWLTLQAQDPEVLVTDDDATKISLAWRIFFTDSSAKQKHLSTIRDELEIIGVLKRSYFVVFMDQKQEKHYLPLIERVRSVTAVYPERERIGIFYDEVEGAEVKPYNGDNVLIYEVRTSPRRMKFLQHSFG